jgi:phytoene dehydrogenase-like protein
MRQGNERSTWGSDEPGACDGCECEQYLKDRLIRFLTVDWMGIMDSWDAIFVGSGINALVGAAILAKAGWTVCVLERNSWIGGNIRTAEVTEPRFLHDLYSGWHPLFTSSEAYTLLRSDLETHGLIYLNTEYPTAALFPDGQSVFLSTSPQENIAHFETLASGDGESWNRAVQDFMSHADLGFGLLGTDLWSWGGLKFLAKGFRQLGVEGTLDFSSQLLGSSRSWLTTTFQSPRIHGLLAPWVLHTGLGPDSAGSGFMNLLIAVALQLGGMPVPRGGGAQLVDGLTAIIRAHGGELYTDCHVDSLEINGQSVVGVRANGQGFRANKAVICSVTPQQLYLHLLPNAVVPEAAKQKARRFRFGRGDMQIHVALSEPPKWPGDTDKLLRTAMVHVTTGLDGVSSAVNEAERGLLPGRPTIVVGQPTAVDPSRAPAGTWILWIQLQELPSSPTGDALGRIQTDGTWSERVRDEFADRVISRLGELIPNLDSAMRKRFVISPADLARVNINLVGGDPYAGSCALDQFLIWRPLPGMPRHRTSIKNLYHIGASTHPGPGLHGASGLMVAKELLGARCYKKVGGKRT